MMSGFHKSCSGTALQLEEPSQVQLGAVLQQKVEVWMLLLMVT